MNWLVYHIVSGQAFFTGIVLLIAAAGCSLKPMRYPQRLIKFTVVPGLLLIAISSTPIPYAYYAFAICVTVGWIIATYTKRYRRTAAIVFATAWMTAALIEARYHTVPIVGASPDRTLTVIGDSVTAGIGGDEKSETWPRILAREHDLQVQDISHMGDTAASALKRVTTQGIRSSNIIIEIGGNDLLGSTTPSQFRADLDGLLKAVESSDRQIVMFELPLPPFCHEFGRLQRTLAHKHRVKLIPKRVFLSIVAGSDSTLDSIHLSQTGHQKMSDLVWNVIRPAYSSSGDK
jgi:acyl-CoA thioesterase I